MRILLAGAIALALKNRIHHSKQPFVHLPRSIISEAIVHGISMRPGGGPGAPFANMSNVSTQASFAPRFRFTATSVLVWFCWFAPIAIERNIEEHAVEPATVVSSVSNCNLGAQLEAVRS